MENITVKINGVELEVPKGTTVLEAAHMAGFEIPTLCYMKEINEIGACRICVTEVNEGRGFRLVAGCVYPCSNNMEILTSSPKVIESRKRTLELILSTHDRKCLSCVRSGNCELQKLAKDYGVEDATVYDGVKNEYEVDNSAAHMYRDNNKCILCRRCVAVCAKTQGIGVIGANERGFKTYIGSAFDMGLGETSCVSCGQCIAVCPVGALSEKDYTKEVMAAIADPEKTVLVQTAPAVRAGLGECFGNPIGTNVEGKMVAALRRLGFDKVFDTDFSADLTIMEEANEFLDRFRTAEHFLLSHHAHPDGSSSVSTTILIFSITFQHVSHLSRCSVQQLRHTTLRRWVLILRTSLWYLSCHVQLRSSRSADLIRALQAYLMLIMLLQPVSSAE